jgi:hypothetical protein
VLGFEGEDLVVGFTCNPVVLGALSIVRVAVIFVLLNLTVHLADVFAGITRGKLG